MKAHYLISHYANVMFLSLSLSTLFFALDMLSQSAIYEKMRHPQLVFSFHKKSGVIYLLLLGTLGFSHNGPSFGINCDFGNPCSAMFWAANGILCKLPKIKNRGELME